MTHLEHTLNFFKIISFGKVFQNVVLDNRRWCLSDMLSIQKGFKWNKKKKSFNHGWSLLLLNMFVGFSVLPSIVEDLWEIMDVNPLSRTI